VIVAVILVIGLRFFGDDNSSNWDFATLALAVLVIWGGNKTSWTSGFALARWNHTDGTKSPADIDARAFGTRITGSKRIPRAYRPSAPTPPKSRHTRGRVGGPSSR